MITHHLSDDFLIEYANGALATPESLVVGSHIAICAECRGRVETFEDVSAVLLDAFGADEHGDDVVDEGETGEPGGDEAND